MIHREFLNVPAIVIASIFAGISAFLLTKKRTRPIQDRPSIKLEDIYRDNYASRDVLIEIFRKHWLAVAKILEEDPTKLRPTDRFDMELRYRNPLDQSNNDLLDYARKALGRTCDLSNIATLDELIILLCRQR